MLVISRKKNESLVIGDDVIVTIVEIREDKVRLGVECPKEIPVHRREVYESTMRDRIGSEDTSKNPGIHKRYLELTEFLPFDKLSYGQINYEVLINKKQLQYIL